MKNVDVLGLHGKIRVLEGQGGGGGGLQKKKIWGDCLKIGRFYYSMPLALM